MRVLFMGTPIFAAIALRALVESGEEVLCVYTQPDKPVGRGMRVAFSPVKEYAITQSIPVRQPGTLRGEAEAIRALKPDGIAVVAYGKILPREILEIPPLGCINVHASLLPKYRGAAPIQWAVMNGETETGVCTIFMAEGMDTGDMIDSETIPIGPMETAGELHDRLAPLGAKLLVKTLRALEMGTVARIAQDNALATYAPRITGEHTKIDWAQPAQLILWQIHGLQPRPAASFGGIKIHEAALSDTTSEKPPGTVLPGLLVVCGDGQTLQIRVLQGPGQKRMTADAYLCGHPLPDFRKDEKDAPVF